MSSPTPPPSMKPDDLDRALTDMTVWKGAEPELWKAALSSKDASPEDDGKWRLDSILSKPLSNRWMLAAVGCIAIVFIVAFMMPTLSESKRSSSLSGSEKVASPMAISAKRPSGRAVSDAGGWRGESEYGAAAAAAPAAAGISESLDASVKRLEGVGGSQFEGQAVVSDRGLTQGSVTWAQNNTESDKLPEASAGSSISQPASPRYVVQKATMDLQTDDVRAAFAKAAHLVSEAGGEFVENSSLTGDGKLAQGNLTLRVAAARVGEVMNKLRELGTVKSENTSGEDVTTQVVDVEARIRNEQRVEKELLELLDQRNDAPLKDILELRGSLSGVRESIERLVGQRDRLGRLVSLASILVVIRAEPLIEKPASTIGDYFTKAVDRAWHGGLQSLSDTVAWMVAVAVGGVMWWIVLTAVVIAIVRWRRRLSARCV